MATIQGNPRLSVGGETRTTVTVSPYAVYCGRHMRIQWTSPSLTAHTFMLLCVIVVVEICIQCLLWHGFSSFLYAWYACVQVSFGKKTKQAWQDQIFYWNIFLCLHCFVCGFSRIVCYFSASSIYVFLVYMRNLKREGHMYFAHIFIIFLERLLLPNESGWTDGFWWNFLKSVIIHDPILSTDIFYYEKEEKFSRFICELIIYR